VNLTGGTLKATNGGGQIDFGTDTNTGNIPTTINSLASSAVSTVGGNRVSLRQASTPFNVAEGAAPVDLLLSAPVIEGVIGSGIAKNGAGTMVVSGTNTYTGATTVNAGTLLVTGSISGSPSTVKSGAIFGGDGVTGPLNVESGATVAPGNPVGTLRTGNLLMASGSALKLEINSAAPATGYDQLSVTGSADITGSTLSLSGTYLASLGSPNDLFFVLLNDNSDGTIGTFNGLPEGSNVFSTSGQGFRITYTANFDNTSFTGGNDIALMPVPEPAVTTSVIAGLGLLLSRRRRRSVA
jgi:autotransporter-associated beta strand protein